jgi:glycosyltransferase involved in cell wall biosynthesis
MNKLIFLNNLIFIFLKSNYLPITIYGLIKSANGLGQVTINLLNIYSLEATNIFFKDSRVGVSTNYDLPENVYKIVKNNKLSPESGVCIFTDQLVCADQHLYLDISDSSIKYAYSMVESTAIPKKWVDILNKKFDAVLVPDNFLVNIYKDSGVEIPIFILPLPILGLEKCLTYSLKTKKPKKFIFGSSAAFSKNKNIELLIKAFDLEFGNNPNVILKIHSYWSYYAENIKKLILELGLSNVYITMGETNYQEHLKEIQSWDCLILLSRGEGYSITPRLAMGLGIPTILSNNTAHKILCDTGFSLPVKSEILLKSESEFYNEFIGYNFDCNIEDASKAMKEMYYNYNYYLEKAHLSRHWVEKYLPKNLISYYLQLIKPTSIELSDKDIICNNKILTTSKNLVSKYQQILGF